MGLILNDLLTRHSKYLLDEFKFSIAGNISCLFQNILELLDGDCYNNKSHMVALDRFYKIWSKTEALLFQAVRSAPCFCFQPGWFIKRSLV